MNGFPKYIATKNDVLNLLNTYPEKTKKLLQNTIDGNEGWVVVSHHTDSGECIVDETHEMLIETDVSGEVSYIQREWKVIPGGDLERWNMTVEEAENLIG